MKVKMKRSHLGFKKDDEVDLNRQRAELWIKEGLAEEVPRKEKKDTTAAAHQGEKNSKAGPGGSK